MRIYGTWISGGFSSVRFMAGLADCKDPFQAKLLWFYTQHPTVQTPHTQQNETQANLLENCFSEVTVILFFRRSM